MTCNIRQMMDYDIDNVYAIETAVHIAPWSKNIIRDCVLVGYDCRVLEVNVTTSAPVLAGYIISRIANNSCHILNLCIAKPLQSKGYGRKLLQTVLHSVAKLPEIDNIVLEVRQSNSIALHLYETLEFKQVEIKKDYYKDKNSSEDAILLKKNLHVRS